jgi:hypothetical protein
MEKRIKKRMFRRLNVKFTYGSVSRNGITSNISENGVFLRTRKVLRRGTKLDLEFTLPSKEVINLCSRVARAIITPLHDKDGMGIELLEIPEKYTEFVKTLL